MEVLTLTQQIATQFVAGVPCTTPDGAPTYITVFTNWSTKPDRLLACVSTEIASSCSSGLMKTEDPGVGLACSHSFI